MPVHRVSQKTEMVLMDWAREHYEYWSLNKTFDEVVWDLVAEVRRLYQELNERE
jgi:hypothetical protein